MNIALLIMLYVYETEICNILTIPGKSFAMYRKIEVLMTNLFSDFSVV